MIMIKNTENLTGVSVIGDYHDLYRLVEAFHSLSFDEESEKNHKYYDMSIQLLGVCYDIRHAYMGDREVCFENNGLDEDTKRFQGIIAPSKNVYYQCNILYPDMMYAMIGLNELIRIRMRDLSKSRGSYAIAFDQHVIWDEAISTIRMFQAAFAKCLRETISATSYTRWIKLMTNDDQLLHYMYPQYMDHLNLRFIHMTREKRLKNLSSLAKKISEYHREKEYIAIHQSIQAGMAKYKCTADQIRIQGNEFPEVWEW